LFHLVLESHDGRAAGADSEEKHEPVSDIDTVVVDSLKALDPEWPIREADIGEGSGFGRLTGSPLLEAAQCPLWVRFAPGSGHSGKLPKPLRRAVET
jgi:hypothetical protein